MPDSTLLVTVGGSCQPIVTAIRTLEPKRVVFACSKASLEQVCGKGTPCKIFEKGEIVGQNPSIVSQCGLEDTFDQSRDIIIFDDPDNLEACVSTLHQSCAGIGSNDLRDWMVDYTGGTKTMTIAVVQFALEMRIRLYVTTAKREDTNRVRRGEMTRAVTSLNEILTRQSLREVIPSFFREYNYPAAVHALRSLQSGENLPETQDEIGNLYSLAKALDAWDKFDHSAAIRELEPLLFDPGIRAIKKNLERIIESRHFLDATDDTVTSGKAGKAHGYEVVEDLILNAERRAERGRFDDAIGRIYRSLELMAQVCLSRRHGLHTGDIAVDKLPSEISSEYDAMRNSKGKIQIGLIKAWELVAELDDSAPEKNLGALFRKYEGSLRNALNARNTSILAHGFTPVTQAVWRESGHVMMAFLHSGIEILKGDVEGLPQFKKSWNFSGSSEKP